jgi:glycerophosphoryl diester phosphodiesterase
MRTPLAWAFDLQGHRGARGLWPENTLPGFRAAAALGITSVELDVVIAADGVPVVCHDQALHPDLARSADGAWVRAGANVIGRMTSSMLAGFDVGRARPGSGHAGRFPRQQPIDGARIPVLQEVLELLRGTGVRIDIEIKPAGSPDGAVAAVFTVVDKVDGANISFRSFDWQVLRVLRRLRPAAQLAWLTSALPRVQPAQIAAEIRHTGWPRWSPAWAPDHRTLRKTDVAQARAAGLRVLPYTVNEPARMAQLLEWGVHGFCTDYPDVARCQLAEAGIALPAPVKF